MSGMKDILDGMDNQDREAAEFVQRIDTSGVEVVEMSRKVITQAEQGSITAILQLLNESLMGQGVRTRAVLEGRVLHLLCEAPTAQALEAEVVIPSVQQILETISPPNFHTVQIYSRPRQEHQSLWLQEIRQGTNPNLLWSQRITLKQPHLLQRWVRQWQHQQQQRSTIDLQQDWPSGDRRRKRRQLIQWGSLALGLGSLVLGLGLGVRWVWVQLAPDPEVTEVTGAPQDAANPVPPVPSPDPSPAPTPTPVVEQPDPFVQAVRLAEQSVAAGKEASSRGDWLTLASQWQQASDWMAAVPESDPRYTTAQDRVRMYRQNSEAALAEADRVEE